MTLTIETDHEATAEGTLNIEAADRAQVTIVSIQETPGPQLVVSSSMEIGKQIVGRIRRTGNAEMLSM